MRTLLAATMILLFPATAFAATPVLRSDVVVTTPVVTVGDMFEGADLYAERALFRSPAPGTTGKVSLNAVRIAAAKIGLTDFQSPSSLAVTVARFGEPVDSVLLGTLVEDALTQKGFLRDGVSAEITFNAALPILTADTSDNPVTLVSLSYLAGNGQFAARFMVSGRGAPVDVRGRADLVVLVPHLIGSLSGDAIIRAEDVELRKVPVRTADTGSFSSLDQVIGMQLRRPARAGKMLQPDDLKPPVLISRNDAVTIVYRAGPLTLTVKGQALNNAAEGETVQVLNLMSSKVLSTVASGQGMVIFTQPGAATPSLR